MKRILLLAFQFILVLNLNAQVSVTQVNISDIYLEFSGESVRLSGINTPIIGQLFYSKDKRHLMTENSNDFTMDKSLVVIRPLIRILKTSENYPHNLRLSIKLYTSEIIYGEEKKLYLDTQFDSYLKDQKIAKIKKTDSNEEYIIFDDGLTSRVLTMNLENGIVFANYIDQMKGVSFINLAMNGMKLTIENGKRVN